MEGLTEFLPVSSTGHMILVGHYLRFEGSMAVTFEIVIQLGAILAVIVYLRRRLWLMLNGMVQAGRHQTLPAAIAMAFAPAAVVGLLVHDQIEHYLFNPFTVALALVLGGVAILVVEHLRPAARIDCLEQISLRTGLWVGVFQILSLFPGVSRSGATIMGGLLVGMRREVATEFSFLLSIPTMLAATAYKFYDHYSLLTGSDLWLLMVGLTTAFVTALIVVATFLHYVKRHTFKPFGYYRIALGMLVLLVLR